MSVYGKIFFSFIYRLIRVCAALELANFVVMAALTLLLALETLHDANGTPIGLSEFGGVSAVPAYAQLKTQRVYVRKVADSESGCNLYFDDDQNVLDHDQPGYLIGGPQNQDPNFINLIDGIITWVVNPELAHEMFQAVPNEDELSVDSFSEEYPNDQSELCVSEQLLHLQNEELPEVAPPLPFFNGFNPEEEM